MTDHAEDGSTVITERMLLDAIEKLERETPLPRSTVLSPAAYAFGRSMGFIAEDGRILWDRIAQFDGEA